MWYNKYNLKFMSSINLLPKNFGFEKKKEKQKKMMIICSAFLISIAVISCLATYAYKIAVSKKSDSLDYEIKGINNNIEKEISDNESFLTVDRIKNVRELLDDHKYFSKVFNIIQNVISEDVYLTESELLFDDGELSLKISGVADNYLTAVNQVAIFKNSYWIDDVKINEISADEGNEAQFEGSLKFKKELVSFREDYWDFGLALLSSKVDRYIKIDEYSAVLIDEKDNNENSIKVKFGGIAYDEERLVLFEDNLKQVKVFVKSISISSGLDKKDNNKIIKFEGEMELKPF